MAGPFGVGPATPGNYGLRAAPGVIQQRPMPVPTVTGPVAQPGVIGLGRPMPSTGLTMPSRVTGLTMPSRTGGVTVQQPSVLVPGGTPTITNPVIARPMPTIPGGGVTPTIPNRGGPVVARPMPTVPGTTPGVTFPNRGGYTPTQPGVLVPGTQPTQPQVPGTIGGTRPIPGQPFPTPGTGQFPSRTTPGTQPGCGMYSNYGLIGFFDKTVGSVVKRLLGIRDVCGVTPGTTTGGAIPLGGTTGGMNLPFGTPTGGTAQPLSMGGMTPLQPRVYR